MSNLQRNNSNYTTADYSSNISSNMTNINSTVQSEIQMKTKKEKMYKLLILISIIIITALICFFEFLYFRILKTLFFEIKVIVWIVRNIHFRLF